MRKISFIYVSVLGSLFIGLMGCSSPTQTKSMETIEQTTIDSAYRPKPQKITQSNGRERLPQKDVILGQATSISNDFYNNLIAQNYPAANLHMHPDALSVTSVDEWIKIYKNAQDKTGKLAFVKMVAHGAKIGMDGGNGYGDYAELIFDAQYKDGNLREKLTFFRKDSTEEVKILGYEYHQILERIQLSNKLKE